MNQRNRSHERRLTNTILLMAKCFDIVKIALVVVFIGAD